MSPSLEKEAILPRLDGIRKNIAKLQTLGQLSEDAFIKSDAFDLAQHHLRLALEGVFHLGSHILSRLPGGRPVEYAAVAMNLGASGVVDKAFAERALVPMARLRNLLVHQYADIDPQRIQTIIQTNLADLEYFLQVVGDLVQHPERLGLTVE